MSLELVAEHGGSPVVVLPYAGAVSSPLSVLRDALGPRTLLSVNYPGHGRSTEPLLAQPEPLLAKVLGELVALDASRPPVLLGISFGARLGYELARRLAARDRPVAGLVIGMARPGHTGIGHQPTSHLPPEQFAAAAVRMGLAAEEVLRLPDAAAVLGALQADLAIVERMPPVAALSPAVPAAVIGADQDWLVPEPALRRWNDLLADPLHLRIPGTHLGWLQDPAGMRQAVSQALDRVTGQR